MIPYAEIGNKIKEYFSEKGLSQQEAATMLGVQQAAVSNQLNGRPFGKNSAAKWNKKHGNPFGFPCCILEVPPRFELGNKGFADLRLTAWLWHQMCGAVDGIRTRDIHLGKVALYH